MSHGEPSSSGSGPLIAVNSAISAQLAALSRSVAPGCLANHFASAFDACAADLPAGHVASWLNAPDAKDAPQSGQTGRGVYFSPFSGVK